MEKIKAFYTKHPYWSLIINITIASIIGITIEYLLNKDFIRSGFYTVLFLGIIEALTIRKKQKKNKSKKKENKNKN